MLTTPAAVWNELGHDDAPEGLVVEHIARASAMVETYCGRIFSLAYVLPGVDGRTLPHDVEAVAIALVAHTLRMRDRDQTIRSDAIEGVGSTTYETGGGTIGAILAPLARYRVPTVA